MDVHPSHGLIRRGTARGTEIGALTGGLTPAFGFLVTGNWRSVLPGLLVAVISAPVGAVVGFLCALPPAVILAWRWDYFVRHDSAARLCTISVCLLMLIAVGTYTAVGLQGDAAQEAIATVPLTVGLVLGANSTQYVLYGPGIPRCRDRCLALGRWLVSQRRG